MVLRIRIVLLFIIISNCVFSQQRYAISFIDKANSPYTIDNPIQFLSQKAIDRRTRSGIPITLEDIPVNQDYIDRIELKGAILCNKSKWMNFVVVKISDKRVISSILNLPFVSSVELVKPFDKLTAQRFKKADKFHAETTTFLNYGLAENQIKIMSGNFLHNKGFKGQGVTIAVLDAGFANVNKIGAFKDLRNENRLLGYWDFVNNNDSVFNENWHGTSVLSTMAGVQSKEFIGTAPEASYWLLRSEDAATETVSEEYNWLAAAEFADSVGADIINSSLGYTTFDDPIYNHDYSDLNGNTTIVTKAAEIAFSKGMLVVNSAGNLGDQSWNYIGAPADGFNVLTIGAVDNFGKPAPFSSEGPSFDGRLKPNVSAVGLGSAIISASGNLVYVNGTSFSAPILSGMAAALWQAFPNKTNVEIKEAIEKSANQYQHPDNKTGYGIPNFKEAYWDLLGLMDSKDKSQLLTIYPQPFSHNFDLIYYSEKQQKVHVRIFDVYGKLVYRCDWNVAEKNVELLDVRLDFISPGMYTLVLIDGSGKAISSKIVKQE